MQAEMTHPVISAYQIFGYPYPYPRTMLNCNRCSEPIREGDMYWEQPNGSNICEGCIYNMAREDILMYFGCTRFEATA